MTIGDWTDTVTGTRGLRRPAFFRLCDNVTELGTTNLYPKEIFYAGGAVMSINAGTVDRIFRAVPGPALFSLAFPSGLPLFEGALFKYGAAGVGLGIGAGIAGFCPGGALDALGAGRWEVFAFTAAVTAGIVLTTFLQSQGRGVRRATA